MDIERTYKFTNENVSSYEKLYNFKNSRVLSVIGSGDQYFSSLLFGAKDVILFDKNEIAILYFIFKFHAIRKLSYEEFYKFFVINKLDDISTYKKIKSSLPYEVKTFFNRLYSNGNISKLVYPYSISNHTINYTTGRVIPYFDKERYYMLQSILNNRNVPFIIGEYLENLNLENLGNFDVMLFSNIYLHLSMPAEDYIKFLKKCRNNLTSDGCIQADYSWSEASIQDFNFVKDDKNSKLSLDMVPSVRYDGKSAFKDYVLTYRK